MYVHTCMCVHICALFCQPMTVLVSGLWLEHLEGWYPSPASRENTWLILRRFSLIVSRLCSKLGMGLLVLNGETCINRHVPWVNNAVTYTMVCMFLLQVFDSQGSFLTYINTSADPLYGPQGIAITEEGSVVVADSGNHCIKIYRYLQWQPPPGSGGYCVCCTQ